MAERTEGYLLVPRWLFKPTERQLTPGSKWSKREAFLDLLERAAFVPRPNYDIRGTKVPLGTGEFSFSYSFLAERWGWKKNTVGYFLSSLMTRGLIQVVRTIRGVATVYRIVNYDDPAASVPDIRLVESGHQVGHPSSDGDQAGPSDAFDGVVGFGHSPGHPDTYLDTPQPRFEHTDLDTPSGAEYPPFLDLT